MLRALLVLLFVANVLAFAWHRGWIGGAGATTPRMEQQINPGRLQLLGQRAATQLARQACLEIGPLEDDTLRRSTAALMTAGIAPGVWIAQSSESGGSWALATIKMPSKEFQARKEETYRTARIAFEPLSGFPEEQPTLVLSRHESEAAAQAALEAMSRRNYKGLRVLRLQAPRTSTLLRLPRIDGAQLGRIEAIANPPWGAAKRSCPVAATVAAPGGAGSGAGGAAGGAAGGSEAAAASAASR